MNISNLRVNNNKDADFCVISFCSRKNRFRKVVRKQGNYTENYAANRQVLNHRTAVRGRVFGKITLRCSIDKVRMHFQPTFCLFKPDIKKTTNDF